MALDQGANGPLQGIDIQPRAIELLVQMATHATQRPAWRSANQVGMLHGREGERLTIGHGRPSLGRRPRRSRTLRFRLYGRAFAQQAAPALQGRLPVQIPKLLCDRARRRFIKPSSASNPFKLKADIGIHQRTSGGDFLSNDSFTPPSSRPAHTCHWNRLLQFTGERVRAEQADVDRRLAQGSSIVRVLPDPISTPARGIRDHRHIFRRLCLPPCVRVWRKLTTGTTSRNLSRTSWRDTSPAPPSVAGQRSSAIPDFFCSISDTDDGFLHFLHRMLSPPRRPPTVPVSLTADRHERTVRR